MKYTATIEMEPGEFIAFTDLLRSVFVRTVDVHDDEDLLDGADHFVPEAENADLDDAPRKKDLDVPTVQAPRAPAPKELDQGAAPKAAPPETSAAPASLGGYTEDKNTRIVRPSGIPTPPADHPLVIRGRKAYFEFVDGWQKNFGIEGTEQPDRTDLIRAAASNNAGPMLAYLRFVGGLVAGIREFWSNGTDPLTSEQEKRSVEIATNIAQVGSVLAPEFTDMLEFVRPDGTVIPHVRYEQVRIPQE